MSWKTVGCSWVPSPLTSTDRRAVSAPFLGIWTDSSPGPALRILHFMSPSLTVLSRVAVVSIPPSSSGGGGGKIANLALPLASPTVAVTEVPTPVCLKFSPARSE